MNPELTRNYNLQAFRELKNRARRRPPALSAAPERPVETVAQLQSELKKQRSQVLSYKKRAIRAQSELLSAAAKRTLLEQELNELRAIECSELVESAQSHGEEDLRVATLRSQLAAGATEKAALKEELTVLWEQQQCFQEGVSQQRATLAARTAVVFAHPVRTVPATDLFASVVRQKEKLFREIAHSRQNLDSLTQILGEKTGFVTVQERNKNELIAENEALAEALNISYAYQHSLPADPPPEHGPRFSPIVEVHSANRNLISDVGSTAQEEVKSQQQRGATPPLAVEPQESPHNEDLTGAQSSEEEKIRTPLRAHNSGSSTPHRHFDFMLNNQSSNFEESEFLAELARKDYEDVPRYLFD